jgi:hypothetical protein
MVSVAFYINVPFLILPPNTLLRFQDPTTTKRGRKNQFFALPFFVAKNFKKFKIILFFIKVGTEQDSS